MKKLNISLGVCISLLVLIFISHNLKANEQQTTMTADSKKVSNQCCYCGNGSTYSYAADCVAGTNSCVSNPCPPPPNPCGADD